ncbi:WD40 repeat-like protein [Ascobolus immersus RN42]|uniref:WD40 repeat-like protein n=1 Tax=Ascobolus immersus RN42 TaxID=1160509 RepID=A0A3N4HZL5_ASCIM|nr:WD40 repeat-like protein [Ascobolus immersus RN42]
MATPQQNPGSPEWESGEEDDEVFLNADDEVYDFDDGDEVFLDAEYEPGENDDDDDEDEDGESDNQDGNNDEDEDDEDEDDGPGVHYIQLPLAYLLSIAGQQGTQQLRMRPRRVPDPKPSPAGRKLMQSGEFGPRRIFNRIENDDTRIRKRNLDVGRFRREMMAKRSRRQVAPCEIASEAFLPSTRPEFALYYPSKVYCGQFSSNGNMFYTCTQDMVVRLYDSSDVHNWKYKKAVHYPNGSWTITDASLTPDGRFLGITSIAPEVVFASTDPESDEEHLLDLSNANARNANGMDINGGIWSIRFSGDGNEIVAGARDSNIYVYDIARETTTVKLKGHLDDVNAVCFGDANSPHIIFSGSDDTTIKVWDRRSLGQGREAGVFTGHVEGLTYIDSKGDGRYVLSNGKDQTMKLWDMRKMMDPGEFSRSGLARQRGHADFDYRWGGSSIPDFPDHPNDISLVTFRGHEVTKTLIRCHFSPALSSGGQYVYSGSADGRVFIYNLDGTFAKVIDMGVDHGSKIRRSSCIRDASWSPNAPVLAASSFTGGFYGEGGMVSLHSYGNDDIEQDDDAIQIGVKIMDPVGKKYRPPPPRHTRFH